MFKTTQVNAGTSFHLAFNKGTILRVERTWSSYNENMIVLKGQYYAYKNGKALIAKTLKEEYELLTRS
jgi:hypothetical protein